MVERAGGELRHEEKKNRDRKESEMASSGSGEERASCLRAAPDRHLESRAVEKTTKARRDQRQCCCQDQKLQGCPGGPLGRCRAWAWRRGL